MQTVPFTVLLAQDAAVLSGRSLADYIRSGGPVGYLIVLLSVAAVSLTVTHLIQTRASKMAPRVIADSLDRLLREGDPEGAIGFCARDENDCFLTRIFGSALRRCSRSPFGFLEMRSALEEAGQIEVDRLHRTTEGVGLIAALGPMLGLLGTVMGMIGAFRTIGSLEGAARSTELAGYMSIALVTTAEGLIVAIPCTAVFTVFKRRMERAAGRAGDAAELLASHLLKPGASPRAERAPGPRAQAARGAAVP